MYVQYQVNYTYLHDSKIGKTFSCLYYFKYTNIFLSVENAVLFFN